MASHLQSIRDVLTSDRDSGLTPAERRRALGALDGELADRMNAIEEEALDTTIHRLIDAGIVDPYTLSDRPVSTSPSSIAHSRRRLNRPLDTIQRHGDRPTRMPAAATASTPPTTRASRLPQLSPNHSSRTRRASADLDSDLDSHLARDGRPLRKRRKLDDGTAEESHPKYGVEGTLIPGTLKMVVLDSDEEPEGQSPENQIAKCRLCLPDNKDAYRTKRNSCDILLKHSGNHPFALSKLVVKLPQRDYDSPALQGMVFVAMNRETLLSQSAHYNSYFPASHSHHRHRYDSYRPSVDYMRSTRSPRPSYRSRPMPSFPRNHNLWYDSRLSAHEMVEVPSISGIRTTLERVVDVDESPHGPRSPRPWDPDYEYTRRSYMNRHPGANRARGGVPLPYIDQSSPATSDDEDDEEQDHGLDRDQAEQDDPDDPPIYRGLPPSRRDIEDAEVRQRQVMDQMRVRRDRADGYSYVPADPHHEEDDTDHLGAHHMAILGGFDVDALRRHARGRATGPNTQNSRPTSPQFHSTKRLPGCTGMLQGQSPHSASDRDPVVPHAMFSVNCDSGGAVAINFQPEVSGIYILVKLWALCPNSCVHVQNVLAYGFGTVRQMADIEFR